MTTEALVANNYSQSSKKPLKALTQAEISFISLPRNVAYSFGFRDYKQ
jgi:hypothetical protein